MHGEQGVFRSQALMKVASICPRVEVQRIRWLALLQNKWQPFEGAENFTDRVYCLRRELVYYKDREWVSCVQL